VTKGASLTLFNPSALGRGRPPRANAVFPTLAQQVFLLEQQLGLNGRRPSARCLVSCNATFIPHRARPTLGPSLIVRLGSYRGGGVMLDGEERCVRAAQPLEFRHDAQTMWSTPFEGECFTLLWFTPLERDAEQEAREAAAAFRPPLRYRSRSSDENVLRELCGAAGCYAGPTPGDPRNSAWGGEGIFAVEGHTVLDVGAHIGVFARHALDGGATHVVALEPEPSNFALLATNCETALAQGRATLMQVALSQDAPAAGGEAQLLLGKPRSDGVANTWRHALAGLSHYRGEVATVAVRTAPLFGEGGLLSARVTFVKLDCEGAELRLLANFERGAWLNVRRLIFEWSFTKERRMEAFRAVVTRLEAEGFTVMYEGRGTWDQLEAWPPSWKTDAIVFAARASGADVD